MFDCTTRLDPTPAGSAEPYITVPCLAEFEQGHIPGADFLDLENRFKKVVLRKYPRHLLGAVPVDVPMVQVGQALAEGRMDAMITSAVTGVENKVWGGLKHYYELNAWFPKNIVFVNAKAFAAQPPAVQQAVLRAAVAELLEREQLRERAAA